MQGNLVSVAALSLIECVLTLPTTHQASQFISANKNPLRSIPFSEETASHESERKPLALVVDDAPDLAEMLSLFLTHAGYEVVTANSARAAIEAAESTRFDVVISDIGMPRMNGYELARILRALPEYAAVPMIAVTGFSMYDDRERSLQSGFNAHVTKPIDPVFLFELIERLRG